jgi:hypothetical protein
VSILRRFERQVDEKLRKLFSASAGESKDMLEIHRSILDEITTKIQPLRRGKRGFPYDHVIVHIPVPDPERRASFAMTFADGDELTADIRDALLQADCDPPSDLRAEVVLDEQEMPPASARGFHIVYRRRDLDVASSPASIPAAAQLRILGGKASKEIFPLDALLLNIGRLNEVLDDHHRLVRRNDVVFEDGDDPANATVSRAHAHIQFDAAAGEYRLYDDHSAYGTSLFRGSALIHVPGGSGRGVALRPGDEIYFGRAHARFEAAEE